MAAPHPKDWISAYANVQKLADRDILAVLKQAHRDIQAMLRAMPGGPSISEAVRREQLLTVQRHILRQQAIVFERLGDIINARAAAAASAASNLGSTIDDLLFGVYGDDETARNLRTSLAATSERGVEAAVARLTLSEIPLAARIYNTQAWMDGRIQRGINSALARGLSAREFAKEATDWFDPNTPGGVRYAAMRLARTEINNAFHATSIQQAEEKPWIGKMQWHLSSSHPKADLCDAYAKGGVMGDGIYAPRDVPRKPHPHCFCYVVPISPSEDDFLDNLLSGNYDKYLKDKALPAPPNMKPTATPRPVSSKPKANPAVPKSNPTATPQKKDPRSLPAPSLKKVSTRLEAELRDKNKIMGRKGARVHGELMKQAEFTPRAIRSVSEVVELNGNELAEWTREMGPNAVGGYRFRDRKLMATPHVFTEAYERGFQKEIVSKWSSVCGRAGTESFIAHEMGHHLDEVIKVAAPEFRRPIWEEIADNLGVARPKAYDDEGLYWFTRINNGKLEDFVSIYGSSSPLELIAEIWAEYSTNPNARPHIKKIGKLIHRLVEEAAAL